MIRIVVLSLLAVAVLGACSGATRVALPFATETSGWAS